MSDFAQSFAVAQSFIARTMPGNRLYIVTCKVRKDAADLEYPIAPPETKLDPLPGGDTFDSMGVSLYYKDCGDYYDCAAPYIGPDVLPQDEVNQFLFDVAHDSRYTPVVTELLVLTVKEYAERN
jgi:hypothetical protein